MKNRYYVFHTTIDGRKIPYGIYDAVSKSVSKSSIAGLESIDPEVAEKAMADLQVVLDILNKSNAVVVTENLKEKQLANG